MRKEIDAQESLEKSIQNELEIRNRYSNISVEEKEYLLDMIQTFEEKQNNPNASLVALHYYQTEFKKLKDKHRKKYFKKVVTFNENYESGRDMIFCSTEPVELTNEEIKNVNLFIEQMISDARRIQLWEEDIHNRNIKIIRA